MVVAKTDLPPKAEIVKAPAMSQIRVIDSSENGVTLIVPATYRSEVKLNCDKEGRPVNWQALQGLESIQRYCS